MIVVLALLIIATIQIPVEYKGWINNSTLYFQSNSVNTQSIQQQFLQCHSHICSETYFISCDRYVLVKNYSLAECMKQCCNERSNFSQQMTILDFLSQCQLDFLESKNSIVTSMNRLPIFVMVYTLIGLVILLIICIGFAFSEEIMHWGRQRLSRDRNEAGIELRHFIN